jgi:hypothetical protein
VLRYIVEVHEYPTIDVQGIVTDMKMFSHSDGRLSLKRRVLRLLRRITRVYYRVSEPRQDGLSGGVVALLNP